MRGEGSRWEAKGSLPHIRKATLYQRYRMRPLRLLCFSCVLTLRKVEIPTWAQRHIVRRHYPKRKHGKRSMSYEKVIPPHSLFNIVIDLLRSDLKASEKREFTLPIGSGTAECWDYVTSNKNVGLQTFIIFYNFEPKLKLRFMIYS